MPQFLSSRIGQDPGAAAAAQGIQSLLDFSQAERSLGLESMRGILAVSQALYQQEHGRLKSRLGADHPEVKALELRIQAVPSVVLGVEAALGEARVKEPAAKPDRAVIYGRVLDPSARGLQGLTVSWEDEQGKPLRSLGEARTDADGSFTAELPPEAMAQVPDKGVYAVYRNASGTVLLRESKPIKPVLGGSTAVSVRLERSGAAAGSSVVVQPSRPAPGTAGRPKPVADPWKAYGEVRDATGKPAAGLLVTAYDRDVLFDDTLGAGLTGPEGAFSITYGHREFREKETGPDLYLRLSDASGREIHTTQVRPDASREEYFPIRLPAAGGGDQGGPAAPKPSTPPPAGTGNRGDSTAKPATTGNRGEASSKPAAGKGARRKKGPSK